MIVRIQKQVLVIFFLTVLLFVGRSSGGQGVEDSSPDEEVGTGSGDSRGGTKGRQILQDLSILQNTL